MRSWNLLNFPALAQRRRQRHRVRTSLAGCLLGVVLSGALAQWMALERERLQAEQAAWQAQLNEVKQRAQERRAHERQQQTWDRQWHALRQVLHAQQTWAAWLHALQQEAPRGSWQLLRLEQEPGRLELHGMSPDVRSLGLARDRLAAQLRLDLPPGLGAGAGPGAAAAVFELNLHSVNLASAAPRGAGQADRGGQAVEFILQASWPVLATSDVEGGKSQPSSGTGERP
jgi:hypothetical protein